jgi:SRSO17 transposase
VRPADPSDGAFDFVAGADFERAGCNIGAVFGCPIEAQPGTSAEFCSFGATEPSRYWLSNLPAGTSLRELVYLAKLRWRIERDFEELKQEFGLNHFEGRSWRGFHHHATLCIAAYGFLVAERCAFSPDAPRRRLLRAPADLAPRGAPAPSAAS